MKNNSFFFVKNRGQYTKVNFDEVLFIKGCRNYVKIITEKSSFLVLICMKDAEQFFTTQNFIRIHKSYIVAINKISSFSKFNVYVQEHTLPISNQHVANLLNTVSILERKQTTDTIAVKSKVFEAA